MRLSTLWRPLALPLLALAFALPAQAQTTFSNTTLINVPDGTATPYPSTIAVTGLTTVTDVNVTLNGFSHTFPDDVDVLVVSPTGTRLIVMSDAGGSADAVNLTLTFDDAAASLLPDSGPLVSGTFKPSNFDGGDGDPFPAPAPTTGTLATTLAGFNGAAANGNGTWSLYVVDQFTGDTGQYAGGWSLTFNTPGPVAPAFALSPTTTQALGTAGACATQSSLRARFTVTNTGGGTGTLNITNATVTGSPGFTVDTSNLPVSLAAGQSTVIIVTFLPAVAQTGAQTGSFTVTYNTDGSTAQTSTAVTVNATATNVNASFATGSQNTNNTTPAGIAFRNSDADCSAASTLPAPSATILPFTTHTRLDTMFVPSGTFPKTDDGSYRLTAAQMDALLGAARGEFRHFGQRVDSLWINSNLNVTFGSPQGGFTGFLPSSTGGGSIQVGAHDVTLNNAPGGTSYASDRNGVGGRPGIFLGTADADGDGDQDLVITWYHAYDFGSVVYNGDQRTTAARYLTAQLIIKPSDEPNADALVEMRFPSGNDANGVPWRINTSTAQFATTQENDATVGLTDRLGTASAEYHDNTVGGTMYDGLASLGVSFVPETQAVTSAGAGYRLMGAPVTQFTIDRLADLNLVQGVPGPATANALFPPQYPAVGDNVLTAYDGTNFLPPTATDNVLAPGRGFFWYLYNLNLSPNPANDGTGTSKSYDLPMMLQGTGFSPTTTQTVPLITAGTGFNMVANPFRASLNVSPATVNSWATGGTLASGVVQTWDPAANGGNGSYRTLPGDVATAWQGFFVQNNTTGGATALAIPVTSQTTGGTFIGRGAPAPTLAFELSGADAATGALTVDVAATLAVTEGAADGWDLFDASKLAPLAAAYATVGFQGVSFDGTAGVKAQESRSLDAASFDVPLVVDAVGTAPSLTLSWAGLDALPEGWAFELRDVVTGETVDLRTTASYTFDQTAGAARDLSPMEILARTTTDAQAAATADARFVLHVTTGRVVSNETGVPTVFALAAPAPNPTSTASTIAFDVPEASDVSVTVYDLLGRRVAVLAQGQRAPGRHTARIEAGTFAPGVYVVRMEAGSFSATQRVTVVR